MTHENTVTMNTYVYTTLHDYPRIVQFIKRPNDQNWNGIKFINKTKALSEINVAYYPTYFKSIYYFFPIKRITCFAVNIIML